MPSTCNLLPDMLCCVGAGGKDDEDDVDDNIDVDGEDDVIVVLQSKYSFLNLPPLNFNKRKIEKHLT